MKKKPPIFYIFILLLNVEFFTVILLWLSLKDPFDYPSVLYRSVIIFSVINLALGFAIELIKDLLLKDNFIIVDYFKYRFRNAKQIISIGFAKLKQRYKGAALGWTWAIIRPAITIFVYWFAIAIGLRNGNEINGHPFFLWLIAGFIPWYYMRDMITYGAGCFRNNSYLLKVAKYPNITIPAITNLSLIPVHIGLVTLMIIVFLASGYSVSVYLIQLPIYMLLMFVFFGFWGLFAGIMSAVSKDFMNLVNSLVTAVMWLSGIFYDYNNFDSTVAKLLFSFNPITIIVTGYRHCFIDNTWFYEDAIQLFNFCLVLLFMVLLSIRTYKKFGKILPDLL